MGNEVELTKVNVKARRVTGFSCCSPESLATFSFLFVIYLARICHGLYMSIPSPTMLFLAQNVNGTVASISPIFTGRSIGMMVGAMLAGVLLKAGKPMVTLGLAVLLSGIFMLFIPFVTSTTMLFLLITGAGLMAGYLDAGMQALLLKLWGEQDSRSHIQAFHFMFTIGAFLAPLLVRPFLVMASETSKSKTKCPGFESNESKAETGNTTAAASGINPVSYAFIISAVFMVFVSLCFFIMAGVRITTKIKRHRKEAQSDFEDRPEEPLKDVWILFLLVILFYFFLIGGEHPYVAYIFSICVCTKLNFSESDASLLNSVLWMGFGAGRLTGVVAAKFLKPGVIILICLIGGLLAMVVMSISGTNSHVVPWVVTFFYGYFLSMLYPAGVSWTSRITNISGNYMFIINFGNAIGSMSMTPVGGVIFQQLPLGVIYFSTAFAFGNLVVFAIMVFYAKRRRQKLLSNPEYDNNSSEKEKILESKQ